MCEKNCFFFGFGGEELVVMVFFYAYNFGDTNVAMPTAHI